MRVFANACREERARSIRVKTEWEKTCRGLLLLAALLGFASWDTILAWDLPDSISRIALGSCADQEKPQPIWEAIVAADPDLFLFLGDNVYADTEDMEEMRAAYRTLLEKPGYQRLLEISPILAVWDDHDYGVNDGGAEYPSREGAERVFHEFFGTPESAPSRKRPGIYDSHLIGEEGNRLQIIRLDTRYFRGPLSKLPVRGPQGPYKPSEDASVTMLGEAQWSWLEKELMQPADLRIIATSIQFLPVDHRWERWENLPHERRRFLGMLKKVEGPVFFVSGDRHMGELQMMPSEDPLSPGFPIYELTTSGLTNAGGGGKGEPNRYRIGPSNFQKRNFGLVEIDWAKRKVRLELRDVEGETVDSAEFPFP
ncbi:MAG: alkaline phosphatase D family protein [Verrucomicrobiota bacterium]